MTDKDLSVIPQAPAIRPASGADGRIIETFDPVRQAVFLQALRSSPIVGQAARAAGITTTTAYRLRSRSRAFAEAWDRAREDAVDEIEAVAIKRACEGSDQLMGKVLAAHRPDLYGNKVDVRLGAKVEFVVDLVPMAPGPPPDDGSIELDDLEAESVEPAE